MIIYLNQYVLKEANLRQKKYSHDRLTIRNPPIGSYKLGIKKKKIWNVLNISQHHKLYPECHGKLEVRIEGNVQTLKE